jgi:beta-lactamase regulating signal transducer with metallopeptidase domain
MKIHFWIVLIIICTVLFSMLLQLFFPKWFDETRRKMTEKVDIIKKKMNEIDRVEIMKSKMESVVNNTYIRSVQL